jgi:hypothetical protein
MMALELYYQTSTVIGAALLVALSAAHAQVRAHLPPLDRVLPPRAESIYAAVSPRVQTDLAMATVREMAPHWRLAGNPAYDQAIDYIAAALSRGNVAHHIDSFANAGQGWEQRRASS